MSLGRTLLRVTVGSLFVGHGTQKLFGWFGGGGLDATAQTFEQLGMKPGRTHALAAGAAEAGGGALLATGRAAPLAASALTATMLTAIDRVHGRNGPWVTNGGWEYNAVLIAAVLTLAEGGMHPRERGGGSRGGSLWALAALAGGVAGALGARRVADCAAASEAATATVAPAHNGAARAGAPATP